ncbi:expressed protein [Echinococcus multilocularis]|uniref:Expressed protein n=1 Tax=Echinococcus multilocularis TaxID=6211 RepID=A0A087VXR0_ECHMU|nr:expressed protein [Echinococcus multilocularis]
MPFSQAIPFSSPLFIGGGNREEHRSSTHVNDFMEKEQQIPPIKSNKEFISTEHERKPYSIDKSHSNQIKRKNWIKREEIDD